MGIINGDVALMLIESLLAEADKKGSRLLRGGSRPKPYISNYTHNMNKSWY